MPSLPSATDKFVSWKLDDLYPVRLVAGPSDLQKPDASVEKKARLIIAICLTLILRHWSLGTI